ncbi:MAG TPA: SRPBCC domain-containing protein [Gaiellaceae bacterium]|nr:SRPBCC domain-containing protein [Gaiellaceae bacterium]
MAREVRWVLGRELRPPRRATEWLPGGAWRLTMFAEPGRREIHWKGEYREVVEPERLVFTLSDQPGDDA